MRHASERRRRPPLSSSFFSMPFFKTHFVSSFPLPSLPSLGLHRLAGRHRPSLVLDHGRVPRCLPGRRADNRDGKRLIFFF